MNANEEKYIPEHQDPEPREPDVAVTVDGGVACVEVLTPNLLVEVRDYDIDGCDESDLWEDETGDQCLRYFVNQEGESPDEPPHTQVPPLQADPPQERPARRPA